jgi:hypothetical protein
LFGRNDLIVAHSKSVSSYHDSRLPFLGAWTTSKTDAFNRQTG